MWDQSGALAVGGLHQTLFIALPVVILLRVALVVHLLAFAQRDLTFYVVTLPIQGGGDTGVALLLGGGKDLSDFPRVQQESALALWVGYDMRARAVQALLGSARPANLT